MKIYYPVQVDLSPPAKGETLTERVWRQCFNILGKMNVLAMMRRTLLYNNTKEAVLRWWRMEGGGVFIM